MKTKWLGLAGIVILISTNVFSADVIFNDPNLLYAVRAQYEAQVGVPLSDPPQDTELANPAFQSLDASYLDITDLTGLEACTSLEYLNLISNQITNLSPLSGLTNLTFLMLGKNQITDISNLSGLMGLQYLDIGINQISDISALSSLTNLVALNLGFGNFFIYDDFDPFVIGANNLDDADLTVLSTLTNLEALIIGGLENVTDIGFLNNLNNLTQLWLGHNSISNWTPLGNVNQNLNSFFSINCGLGQAELDTYVANMNIVFVDGDNPGLLGILDESNITDISSLSGLNPTYAFFAVLPIDNIDVIQNWTNLDTFICAYTNINNINAILGLPNLSMAQLPGNQIGPTMFVVKQEPQLNSLISLDLSENNLTNLVGIEYMPNLVGLNASYNQINNISALNSEGAPSATLETLNLEGNQITDISPLLNYTSLNYINLRNNLIEDFGYLVNNTGIGDGDYIDISYNPVPEELCYLINDLEQKVQPSGYVERDGVCQVTITIEIEGVGTVLPSVGQNIVEINSNFVILAYPIAGSGYAFDHWEKWNEETEQYDYFTDSMNYYFFSVTNDMRLKAIFVPGTYNLTFTINPSSTGTGIVIPFYDGNGVYSFKQNQYVLLYAIPDEGYCFGGWTGDAQPYGTSQGIYLLMNSDKTVGAIFSNECYELTLEAIGDGYTIPYMGTYKYVQNAMVNIYAYPNAGYTFDHWEDGENNNLGTSMPLTIEMNQNRTIRAIFTSIPTLSLTISVNGNGTTNPPPGSYEYTPNSIAYITAIPDDGWLFESWSGDIGWASPYVNPIEILMDDNKEITANFKRPDYFVTLSVEGPGTTNPEPGTYGYIAGQWSYLIAIPESGKAFLGWFENDELVYDYPMYSFEVTSDRNIVARFGEPEYTIEIAVQGNGTTYPPPGIYGFAGETWTYFTAYPDEGWGFKFWKTSDEQILSTDEFLTLYVQESLSIIAVFEPCQWNVNIATAGTGTGETYPYPGEYCYTDGKELFIMGYPNFDSYFSGWEVVKSPLQNPETTWIYWFEGTVTIDNHYNLIAHFEDEGWNFDLQIEGDGEVFVEGTDTVVYPSLYQLTNNFPINLVAIPAEFQQFKGWYSGDTLISTEPVYNTTLNNNLQLKAKFAPPTWYGVTIFVAEGQGTTNPSPGAYQFPEGNLFEITAIPAQGWRFDSWIGDLDGVQNVDQPTIIVPIDRNRNIGVIFVQQPAEGEGTIEGEGTAEGAPEGEIPPPHSADQNGDGQINLSELLRVIQFFNFGSYHCDPQGEDGYAPGPGDQNCVPHASDYNPQDWVISLSELLRVIQFFNIGGYYPCEGGEDGYCPGTP